MIRGATITLLVFFSGWISVGAQTNPVARTASSQQQSQQKADPKASKAEPKEKTASLTGCMDEQEGQWVLVNDKTMAVLAHLAADGFPTEGFAKHMGQKVTVRGTVISDGPRAQFKVRTIETISETCVAQ